MLQSASEGKASVGVFRRLDYGMANCWAIIALLAVKQYFGIDEGPLLVAITGLLFALTAVLAGSPFLGFWRWSAPNRRNRVFVALTALLAAVLLLDLAARLAGLGVPSWLPGPATAASVYSLLIALPMVLRATVRFTGKHNPALVLPASFLIVILLGALMLMHPRATRQDLSIGFTDAFFTSASATCVTGLIVLDTERDFTRFGQVVIMLLLQAGGLGIMTFAAFFALSFGRNLRFRDAFSLSRMMDTQFITDLKRMVLSIFIWTFTIEAAGAVLLASVWRALRPDWSALELVWQATFHSASAFCNAGFSLNSTNLEGFSGSPATSVIIGSLIVLGGLGFGVLTDVSFKWMHFVRTGFRQELPLQARFVCLVTLILILLGFAAFLGLEWNNTLSGMSLEQKLANSFLSAVTPRTAGFNTVPTGSLLPQVKWLFIMLMFIGASPGGTAGGVKTTALGLMFLSARSLLQGKVEPEIWKRRVPNFDLRRAGAMFTIGFTVFSLSALSLLASEHGSMGPRGPMDIVFEAMSAFGTVGLSTGVTPGLTVTGRWIVIITMFLGRTAPATLAAATFRIDTSRYKYPEARITIG